MSYNNLNYSFRRDSIIGPAQLKSTSDIFHPTADQRYALGCELTIPLIGKYRYLKAAATEIAKNLIVQSEALDAQQLATIQTAYGASAAATKFNVLMTTGNAVTDHELIDGILLVNDGGAAMGDMYIIKDNYWVTSDTVLSVEIADAGGLRNAVAATDDLTPIKNKYRDVIVKPTTLTAPVVGCTTTIIPASYYFWAQYRGLAAVMVDTGDTIVVGEPVGHIDGSGTAGSVGLVATHATDTVFGTCVYPSTGDEVAIIDLMLP